MAKFGTFSNLDFKYGNVNVASIFKGANKIFGYPSATGGTETYIEQNGKYYKVHTFTDTDPTSLLLNFDGSNGSTTFTDESGWGHTVTANGDAQISTTQSKFGGSSLALDGTGDYLSIPDSDSLRLGSGDFTIEGWVYLTSSVDNVGFVSKRQPTSFSGTDWRTAYRSASGKFSWFDSIAGELFTPTISLNTWVHIAFVRVGTTLYCYANGVLGDTGTVSSNFTNTNAMTIGINTASFGFPGYIDSLRITKGQALYTSNFTPSTTALTRVGSGSLVVSQGGEVEYLVVGGGGGGGASSDYSGGGGGAGGLMTNAGGSGLVVSPQEHPVAVGAGGTGASVGQNQGGDGSDSHIFSLTSVGGGGGGTREGNGRPGGSGGGGGSIAATSGGVGTAGQGNSGGDHSGADGTSGGGGGASETGSNAPQSKVTPVGTGNSGGDGGDGLAVTISGSPVYYAGGGGGGARATDPTMGGDGGLGGGGNGADSRREPAQSGENGKGGGGGGGSGDNGVNMEPGGDGGSGIVIVRYPISKSTFISNS